MKPSVTIALSTIDHKTNNKQTRTEFTSRLASSHPYSAICIPVPVKRLVVTNRSAALKSESHRLADHLVRHAPQRIAGADSDLDVLLPDA